jgi:hypothetical protein
LRARPRLARRLLLTPSDAGVPARAAVVLLLAGWAERLMRFRL